MNHKKLALKWMLNRCLDFILTAIVLINLNSLPMTLSQFNLQHLPETLDYINTCCLIILNIQMSTSKL